MKNNKVKIMVGVLAGIIILGTAAFVGGKLLNTKSSGVGGSLNFDVDSTSISAEETVPTPLLPKTDPLVNGTFSETKDNVGGILNFGDDSTSIGEQEMVSSPLLPKTDPLVYGTLSERKDNIVLVQTISVDAANGGGDMVAAVPSEDVESGEIVTDFVGEDGPKIEVVVNKDSIIYSDVTEFHYTSDEPAQQKLETCTLDELSKASIITVWGRKVGDRIIADVFVIYNPSYVNVP